jgi:hypothetical protein
MARTSSFASKAKKAPTPLVLSPDAALIGELGVRRNESLVGRMALQHGADESGGPSLFPNVVIGKPLQRKRAERPLRYRKG